jgi:hypothetical protein
MQVAAAQHVQNAGVIATFAKRRGEASITAGAMPKIAEATSTTATTGAETSIANAIAIQ